MLPSGNAHPRRPHHRSIRAHELRLIDTSASIDGDTGTDCNANRDTGHADRHSYAHLLCVGSGSQLFYFANYYGRKSTFAR